MVTLGEFIMVLNLVEQGLTVTAISRRTGLDRKTVRKYIDRGLETPTYTPRPAKPTVVGPFEIFLRERVTAVPELTAKRLLRELREFGLCRGLYGAEGLPARRIAPGRHRV